MYRLQLTVKVDGNLTLQHFNYGNLTLQQINSKIAKVMKYRSQVGYRIFQGEKVFVQGVKLRG